jgi:hypothetical protein
MTNLLGGQKRRQHAREAQAMSSHRRVPSFLSALFLALCIIPPIAFVAAIPWLKQQPDHVVFVVTGIASTLTVMASIGLSVLSDRRMDEWQRTNARFSSQWGWTAGAALVALLLALPPVHDLIVSLAANMAPNPDRGMVLIVFTAGFIAVVMAQVLCTVLMSIGWTMWKSRPTPDAS